MEIDGCNVDDSIWVSFAKVLIQQDPTNRVDGATSGLRNSCCCCRPLLLLLTVSERMRKWEDGRRRDLEGKKLYSLMLRGESHKLVVKEISAYWMTLIFSFSPTASFSLLIQIVNHTTIRMNNWIFDLENTLMSEPFHHFCIPSPPLSLSSSHSLYGEWNVETQDELELQDSYVE